MKGDIPDDIYYRLQIDFNSAQDGEFKDVYIGSRGLPRNQSVQIGIQKRPFGLDHWNSSRFNIFLERPFVVEGFNEDTRRPGLAAHR